MGGIEFAHNIIRNCEVYAYPVGFQSDGTHSLITRTSIHEHTGFLLYPGWIPWRVMCTLSLNVQVEEGADIGQGLLRLG